MEDYSIAIIWLCSIVASIFLAKSWNKSWFLWGGLSIALGPIATIILGIVGYNETKKENERRLQEEREEEARRAEIEENARIERERLSLQKEAEEEYLLEKAEKIAMIREALSDADIRAGVIGAAKCPSCGASFKAVGSVAVCPYCESVFSID